MPVEDFWPMLSVCRRKEKGIYECGNNVVEGVRTSGDAESTYCKKKSEIDSSGGSKKELAPLERDWFCKMAVEEYYVVVDTEQRRRDENRD